MVNSADSSRDIPLDALRGIAAICVLLHHFLLVFYPALFTTQAAHSHTPDNSEASWAYGVLSAAWNGNFAVCIFFVLSGYVLSLNTFARKNAQSPAAGIMKRYPRLVLPVLGSVLLSWLLLSLNAYHNISVAQAYTHNDFWFSNLWNIAPDFLTALHEAFLQSSFYGGTLEYNPVLWTINMEFFGSLLVFAALSVAGAIRNRIVLYIVLAIVLHKSYFLAFVSGLAICDYRHSVYYRTLPTALTLFIVGAAVYLGGFHWLRFLPAKEWGVLEYVTQPATQIIYIAAAAVLVLAMISAGKLSAPRFARVGHWLGKISFSLYLLHLLIIGSFSCWCLRELIDSGSGYHTASLITFALTLIISLAAAHIYAALIDGPAIRLSHALYVRVFRRTREMTTDKESSTTHILKARQP